MKALIKYTLLIVMPLLMMGGLLTSCEDDGAENAGTPVIHYIRVTDPAKSDSLLEAGSLGGLIAIVGDNLGDARELWFNDQEANLNPAFVTNETILVTIPNQAPDSVSNQMLIRFGNGYELIYNFEIDIAAPQVFSMENEYAPAGSTTTITGDFFFEPIRVIFTGGAEAEIVSVEQNEVTFVVPEGAEPGPVVVRTNFGSVTSGFHYQDQRNIILNYDNLTAEGSWRPGTIETEDGIDGGYLVLSGTYNANERIEDGFASQFWGHTRYDEPRQLFEGDPSTLTLKFEARVEEWYGSYLQITWGPYDNAGNQEYWSNLNGRGLWRPWEADNANFTTDGEWITVSIPLSEMVYSHGQPEGDNIWTADMTFDKNVAGTLSFWVIATPVADASPVEIHIDNVRIVPMN